MHPVKKPGGNIAIKIKTVLGTVVSVLTKVVVCLLVAGLLGTVVTDREERSVRSARVLPLRVWSTGRKCTLGVVLRGEVGKVHFGKVYSPKFPWFRVVKGRMM